MNSFDKSTTDDCDYKEVDINSTLAKEKKLDDSFDNSDIMSDKKCSSETDCVSKHLTRFFEKYGRYLAKHPHIFFFIPLIFAFCCSYGFRHFHVVTDTEYLVTPKNGQAKLERQLVNNYFQVNQNGQFIPERGAVLDGFGDVIITARDGGNMLTKDNFQSLINLEANINSIVITYKDGEKHNFSSICATWGEKCIEHGIFLVLGRNVSNLDKITLHYPNYPLIFLGHSLANVTLLQNSSKVVSANATRMTFFVKYETHTQKEIANIWFTALKIFLNSYNDSNINIFHGATNSLEDQFMEAATDIMPKFTGPFILLIIFAILTSMMNDWVTSKPFLALGGVLYSGLSILASFGSLSAVGIDAVQQAGLVPFLAIGVGADNMFILISAWRRTDTKELKGMNTEQRVQYRMGETLKEAGSSITITSLTNILAFGIGAITAFPMVEIFCLYTGLTMLFNYVFCMTFFCSAMVFDGLREERNRHCLIFIKVKAREECNDDDGWFYKKFCSSGKKGRYSNDVINGTPYLPQSLQNIKMDTESDHVIMRFFRNTFGPFLMHPAIKFLTCICYVAYIFGAVYGILHIKKGISFEELSNENSYLADYYHSLSTIFNQYGPAVQVVITGDLDYSDEKIQNDIENIMKRFNNQTEIFYGPASKSWLKEYKKFIREKGATANINTEELFIGFLRYNFLRMEEYAQYSLDISFASIDKKTKIVASRFYVQSLFDPNTENIMLEARRIASSIKEYNVSIFHQTFVFMEQPVVVWPNTVQNIIIAIIAMFLVALLLVPHPMSAVCVTLATASIEAGVVGYMSLWKVNVDFVSMTYLILCIGFSIDFSVHIAYGFIVSKQRRGNNKSIDTLYTLGYPVLQSSTSTLLAVAFLCLSISYLFKSFFKTMFLVCIFGVYHAIIILPTIMAAFHNLFNKKKSSDSTWRNSLADTWEINQRIKKEETRKRSMSKTYKNYDDMFESDYFIAEKCSSL